MSDAHEYLGPDDGARSDDEPRQLLSLQAFRIAVVVLLLVTAASAVGSFAIAREQKADSDKLYCLTFLSGSDLEDPDPADQQMLEMWDCDLDLLRELSRNDGEGRGTFG